MPDPIPLLDLMRQHSKMCMYSGASVHDPCPFSIAFLHGFAASVELMAGRNAPVLESLQGIRAALEHWNTFADSVRPKGEDS